MKRRDPRQHIAERSNPELREELTRGLRGFVDRLQMISHQHRVVKERIISDPDFTMPRRSTDPYDPSNQERMLRGIPVNVKGGMGGAMKGTRPGDGIKLDGEVRGRDVESGL